LKGQKFGRWGERMRIQENVGEWGNAGEKRDDSENVGKKQKESRESSE
jgi:hypothetical protein